MEDESFQQLCRKGVFFYDYFDSMNKLKETVLPDRSTFFNRLNDEECSEKDYKHAKRVWNIQKCSTLRDLSRFISTEASGRLLVNSLEYSLIF